MHERPSDHNRMTEVLLWTVQAGMSRPTVIRLLELQDSPRYVRREVGSKLDPHKDAIAEMLDRDAEVCRCMASQDLATFWACHDEAFRHFGGVPQQIVYDRTKTVVRRDMIRGKDLG